MPTPEPVVFVARTNREELRRLLQLALPTALAQLLGMLMGFVDTVMLGHYSTDAMAAAVTANSIVFGTLMFANGVLFGLDPLIAQAHGAGQGWRAGLAAQRGAVLSLVLSVPIGVAWLFMGDLFVLLGQEPRLAPLAHTYALALIPGIPAFLLASVARSFLQGREIVRPAMYATAIANLVNALANWVLIYGNLGFPELGILGAGIATTTTRIFTLLLLVAWIRGFDLHAGAWEPWTRRALDPAGLRAIVAIGVPIAIQVGTEMWAFNLAMLLAGTMGATSAAAHGVAIGMASLSFMLALGVAVAATTRVGNLLGAGRSQEAQRSARVAMSMGAGVMTVSAVAFVALRDVLPLLYTRDAEVVALAAAILPIAAAFQVFDGTQAVGCGVLRGMGRTTPAAVINGIGYWLLALPIAWVLGVKRDSLEGIWWGMALGLAVVAVSLVAWIRVRGPASLAPGSLTVLEGERA
ncbi:MAG: MATE family efflux transporter [Myxococcota bacterium]|nr:MATE family efflux transporter [Myxococcales bacterium]